MLTLLICSTNQWTGFYMITASVIKGLSDMRIFVDWSVVAWLRRDGERQKQIEKESVESFCWLYVVGSRVPDAGLATYPKVNCQFAIFCKRRNWSYLKVHDGCYVKCLEVCNVHYFERDSGNKNALQILHHFHSCIWYIWRIRRFIWIYDLVNDLERVKLTRYMLVFI